MLPRWLAGAIAGTLLLACGPGGDGDPADAPAGAEGGRGRPPTGMDGMMGGEGMMGGDGMMQMMRNMPEGIPASELPDPRSEGATLVARYCSQCHGIPTPGRLAAEEWRPTLRRMLVRMERMGRMPMHSVRAPSAGEASILLRYLEEHALRTTSVDSLPPDDADARLFSRACSRCHALPHPAQHTPEEWPAVVERMRENMRRMEVEEITDAEARRIVDFLQEAARGRSAPEGEVPR